MDTSLRKPRNLLSVCFIIITYFHFLKGAGRMKNFVRMVMLSAVAVAMLVGTAAAQQGGKLIGTAQGRHERYDDDRRNGRRNETLTDRRDGQKYRMVRIGNQVWMAENLNYQTGNSWCYGNDNSNCEKYGRLYDWNTAMKVCPAGWHLPSNQEWADLVSVAGDRETAGKALKSTSDWGEGSGFSTDSYGFSALPGGSRHLNGSFNGNVGRAGSWWTATEKIHGNPSRRYMDKGRNWVRDEGLGKSNASSVRCLQDN
jgi:uncharacterized protein (TIGR02145 family)